MRILVTGSDGFIGQRLVEKLEQEHEVFCHTFSDGDITNKSALDCYSEIDYVYHLAACTFVPDSWNKTWDYFNVNIMGTITALEYCRQNRCDITVLSTYVYGEPQYLPIDEAHPLSAVTPYHQSKIIDEELCRFYSEKFNIKVSVFRPFNVYGRGQNNAFLLPKLMEQLLNPTIEQVCVMDLSPKRDYIYINDVVRVLLSAPLQKSRFETYNIGIGQSVSVKEVIDTMMQALDIYKPYHAVGERREDEISDTVADISKIKRELNFEPSFNLLSGIKAWVSERYNEF